MRLAVRKGERLDLVYARELVMLSTAMLLTELSATHAKTPPAIKLVVLGQAKCEAIESPTNARDIARTVARLRRG